MQENVSWMDIMPHYVNMDRRIVLTWNQHCLTNYLIEMIVAALWLPIILILRVLNITLAKCHIVVGELYLWLLHLIRVLALSLESFIFILFINLIKNKESQACLNLLRIWSKDMKFKLRKTYKHLSSVLFPLTWSLPVLSLL